MIYVVFDHLPIKVLNGQRVVHVLIIISVSLIVSSVVCFCRSYSCFTLCMIHCVYIYMYAHTHYGICQPFSCESLGMVYFLGLSQYHDLTHDVMGDMGSLLSLLFLTSGGRASDHPQT